MDYIIFGFYKKVKRKNKLSLFSGIYSDSMGEIIAKLKKTVPTSSNMFTKINELSEEFVSSIRAYVLKQKNKEGKKKRKEKKRKTIIEYCLLWKLARNYKDRP